MDDCHLGYIKKFFKEDTCGDRHILFKNLSSRWSDNHPQEGNEPNLATGQTVK